MTFPAYFRNAIGVFPILGCVSGVMGSVLTASKGSIGLLTGGTLVLASFLYLFGAYCGIAAIKRRFGWFRLNFLFWLIQVPVLASQLVSYRFASGWLFSIWVKTSPIGAGSDFWLGSTFTLKFFNAGNLVLGMNLVAFTIVIYMLQVARKLNTTTTQGG
ncbi:hypothetical protein [Undibacterium sp. Ren11W]|uniref:hypothetical protein n=1 Tax=Undibacterium sp. Ren11W TaxID=3413045 RepID=UPI003BF19E2B